MCGRFTITSNKELIEARFRARLDGPFAPRYNAAPSQLLPIITEDQPDRIKLYRWGLTPTWFKKLSGREALINIRAESLRDKTTFKKDLEARRCLVLADGFYEWQKTASRKLPYWFGYPNRQLFAFAGLWEENMDEDGTRLPSFAIVTNEATEQIRPIHHRMPVIIPPADESIWLKKNCSQTELLAILKAVNKTKLEIYPVSPLVNDARTDLPKLLEPLELL